MVLPQASFHLFICVCVCFFSIILFYLSLSPFFSRDPSPASLPLCFPSSSLCLQRNLFSTEDIFNSLLRLASNRSGGVGGRASEEKTSADRRERERERVREGGKGGGQTERQAEGEIMR